MRNDAQVMVDHSRLPDMLLLNMNAGGSAEVRLLHILLLITTKMLPLNAPFFPLKCLVYFKKVTKMLEFR